MKILFFLSVHGCDNTMIILRMNKKENFHRVRPCVKSDYKKKKNSCVLFLFVIQLFLHRIFGYRSVILFPWLARVFDRCEGRSNGLPPLPKSSQSNIHEIRARSVTYYQVLIDTRDMPHIRAQTGLINFIRIKFKKTNFDVFRSCDIFG